MTLLSFFFLGHPMLKIAVPLMGLILIIIPFAPYIYTDIKDKWNWQYLDVGSSPENIKRDMEIFLNEMKLKFKKQSYYRSHSPFHRLKGLDYDITKFDINLRILENETNIYIGPVDRLNLLYARDLKKEITRFMEEIWLLDNEEE